MLVRRSKQHESVRNIQTFAEQLVEELGVAKDHVPATVKVETLWCHIRACGAACGDRLNHSDRPSMIFGEG